jgi:hypothetical protein
MAIYIEDRLIVFAPGRGASQTVNICPPGNAARYEHVFRIPGSAIAAADVRRHQTLDGLIGWLRSIGAVDEGPRERGASPRATTTPASGLADGGSDRMYPPTKDPVTIFLVHGHDTNLRELVENRLHRWIRNINVVVLAQEANRGRTIVQKFMEHANKSDFAVVIATPDDEGRAVGTSALKPRARQNVVFEMGYFFGKLDPHHVVVINEGVERPSDIDGIVYISTNTPDWQRSLARELEAAGIAGNWLR